MVPFKYKYILSSLYIYIYTNLPVSDIVRLPHPLGGDSQGQETFLAPSADKQTRNYDTECHIYIYIRFGTGGFGDEITEIYNEGETKQTPDKRTLLDVVISMVNWQTYATCTS